MLNINLSFSIRKDQKLIFLFLDEHLVAFGETNRKLSPHCHFVSDMYSTVNI